MLSQLETQEQWAKSIEYLKTNINNQWANKDSFPWPTIDAMLRGFYTDWNHPQYMLVKRDTSLILNALISFEKAYPENKQFAFLSQFFQQFVLNKKEGEQYPYLLSVKFLNIDDTEVAIRGGYSMGTVDSSGNFSGTHTPQFSINKKSKWHSAMLKKIYSPHDHRLPDFSMQGTFQPKDGYYYLKSYGDFITEQKNQIYPNTEGLLIVECFPKEKECLNATIPYGFIDAASQELWQAPSYNYLSYNQGPRKKAVLNLFSPSTERFEQNREITKLYQDFRKKLGK